MGEESVFGSDDWAHYRLGQDGEPVLPFSLNTIAAAHFLAGYCFSAVCFLLFSFCRYNICQGL